MKRLFFILGLLGMSTMAFSQDLPENPETGKCYVRCVTPEVYSNKEVTIVTKPSYKKLITHPAEYKSVTEEVLIKEKEVKLIAHPAEWGKETVAYVKKDEATKLRATEAIFTDNIKTIESKPVSANWVMGDASVECDSPDPNDCRVWCYKEIPAEFESFPIKELDEPAKTIKETVPSAEGNYTKDVIVKEAWVEKIEIPAEYKTISRTVLVKDAWVEEVAVPEENLTVKVEVLDKKGGLTVWREVECELTNYNVLPVNWNVGSYTLTQEAKNIIDKRLFPVLNSNPDVMIEIASHTDSRGAKENNKALSDKRAQAVVNYLIDKGINASRLVPMGYGESKLINRCADGVPCTEREHMANRRTEFRIIGN